MKTQNTELRKLAEQYFFGKQQLEEHEILLLKNSKYSNVVPLAEGSVFSRLFENALETLDKNALEKNEKDETSLTKSSFNSGKPLHHANSGDLESLTDSIKDEFDISVPPDYSHVPVEKLKEFIKNYTEQYIEDVDTQFEVKNALKLNDARAIMGSLYTHLSM